MNPLMVGPIIWKDMTGPSSLLVKILSGVHYVWIIFEKKEILEDKNIHLAAAGMGLDLFLTYAPLPVPKIVEEIFRTFGKILLIAVRLHKFKKAIFELGALFQDLGRSFNPKNLGRQEPIAWAKDKSSWFFSAAFINSVKTNFHLVWSYLANICRKIGLIFYKIFEISMRLWDIWFAFQKEHSKAEGVPMLFVNGAYIYRKFCKNREAFMETLYNCASFVDNALKLSGLTSDSKNDAYKVINQAEKKLTWLQESIAKVKGLSNNFNSLFDPNDPRSSTPLNQLIL